MTVILFAVCGFALGFLGAFSMETLSKLVEIIPQWLLNGLSVAGGMLPAIGFAMIMSVMLKKNLFHLLCLDTFALHTSRCRLSVSHWLVPYLQSSIITNLQMLQLLLHLPAAHRR